MSKTDLSTNIFPISNTGSLTTEFSLFRVRGLDRDHEDYFRNRSQIEYAIRRASRAPTCVYEDDLGLVAAVASDVSTVPDKLDVVRATVRLDALADDRELDFEHPNPHDVPLCLNVLHFHFQESLDRNGKLWQPGSGQPVFFKNPQWSHRSLNLFRGFAVRPCILPEGGFGIIVDVKHRYVQRNPLDGNLDRNAFRRWKGRKFIYHFGENWYEIRLDLCLGLSVSEIEFSVGNGKVETLFDYVLRQGGRPLPKELTDLSPDDSAVAYFNGQGDQKSVPASLCFPIETSEHRDARQFEKDVKLRPADRDRVVGDLVKQHLSSTSRNGMTVDVDSRQLVVARETFAVPDLVFGSETVLSAGRKAGGVYATMKDWGKQKRDLLSDRNVGFLEQEPLGRQYLILPQSIADSYGPIFKSGICRAVDELYPQESGYQPREIAFDDRGCRTIVDIGSQIIEAVEKANVSEAHGLVVVPRLAKKKPRAEDELAALVVRELYERGLTVAVSHRDVPDECFVEKRSSDHGLQYVIDHRKRGKWSGYLRGLALNKVLLTNERWPFAFNDRLHADLTIGIDVKNNTAGFVLVGPNARIIRMHCAASRRKERLSEDQLEIELCNLIAAEASHLEGGLTQIEILRDGPLYEEEERGIRRAMERLTREDVVTTPPHVTLLEIRKSSAMSVRLFDAFDRDGERQIRNPQIGDHLIIGQDGFLATTGRPFERPGTARPLHVKYLSGGISFEEALEDVFWMSCLTFTRPEDCSSVPINLRLLDRRLREEASEYDEDGLRYRAQSAERATA